MKNKCITLELGFAKSARLWFGDFPVMLMKDDLKIESKIVAGKPDRLNSGKLAVETFRYFGGKVEYGLLGAEFVQDRRDCLLIESLICGDGNSAHAPYLTPIDSMIDDATVGVPQEFSGAIHRGVSEFFATESVPGGTLRFTCGASSAVGSSESCFFRLAAIVCSYLFYNRDSTNSDEFNAIWSSIHPR